MTLLMHTNLIFKLIFPKPPTLWLKYVLPPFKQQTGTGTVTIHLNISMHNFNLQTLTKPNLLHINFCEQKLPEED